MKPLAIVAAIVLLAGRMGVAGAAEPGGGIRVGDFGAKGDGKTDDTGAFQRAMDEAGKAGGGVVQVPAGMYFIGSHLVVPTGVTLEGTWRAPPTFTGFLRAGDGGFQLHGTTLLAVEGKGDELGTPFVQLASSATIKGLTIYHPEQTDTAPPLAYPWAISSALTGADNCSVVDVLLVNPYQGVDFGGRHTGRHYVRGLYGQPLRRGLYVDMCLDVGRVEDVHFWPFWKSAGPAAEFMQDRGEAFVLGRSDWEQMVGCFCIAYHVGYRFVACPRGAAAPAYAGGGNYQITGGGADGCDVAVQVDALQVHSGASFVNSQIFGDMLVDGGNAGGLRFTGCGMFGTRLGANGVGFGRFAGQGRVSFVNCDFFPLHPKAAGLPFLIFANARVNVTACEFRNIDTDTITLEAGVSNAAVTANNGTGEIRVVNRSKGRVSVANNVDDKGP